MPSGVEEAAAPAGWDVYGIAFEDDPHARWRSLREAAPVHDLGDGVHLVTRWADVEALLRDPRHGAGPGVAASFGATSGPGYDAMTAWLMALDGAPQRRARGLVRRPFTPNRVEALRPLIEETTDALLAPILDASGPSDAPVDLIAALAFPLPSNVIRSLFEIEADDWAEGVEPWITGAATGDGEGAGLAMIEGLARDFGARLASDSPPRGLLAGLAEPDPEHGALSPPEIVANAVLLVTAAIDTTAGLIGNAIHCLLERPALLAGLRSGAIPVAGVVEETLRFEPPALSCSRTAGGDIALGGAHVPAGSALLLSIAAASRDPRRWTEPDRFDPTRDGAGQLAFGGGRHLCLGAALARLEARIALERLLVRAPLELERVEAPVWQRRSPTVRALARLPVRVHRARA